MFCSLYTDRSSHYFFTPSEGRRVSCTVLTQMGRALKHLGIEHMAAYSPPARGRWERMFRTLQDRLPKELALAGITIIEARRTLPRPLLSTAQDCGGSARAFKTIRTVGHNNTAKRTGMLLQLPPSRLRPHFVKPTVRMPQYQDRALAVLRGPHRLGNYDTSG